MTVKRIGMEVAVAYSQTLPQHIDHGMGIPSKFVLFDTNVSSANRYVNVRDELVKRENHNILLARRCKRNVLHLDSSVHSGYPLGQRLPCDAFNGAPELFLPVYLSQHTKQIQIVLRCMQSRAAAAGDHDPEISFTICPHGSTRNVHSSEIQAITTAYVAGGHDADCDAYTWTIGVPAHTAETAVVYGQLLFDLYMMAYAPKKDTAESSGTAITWWGNSMLKTGAAVASVGDVLKVGDDYRMVQQVANTSEYYIDAPWSERIDMGTQTVDVYSTMQVKYHSLSIYEIAATTLIDFQGRA
jgi:hypothetical protein